MSQLPRRLTSRSKVSADGLRIEELDGLRGIACILILIMHSDMHRILFWCWSWVDMFLVISGFLITTMLIDGPRDAGQLLKSFWMRRIFRIWPVYYLGLAFVLMAWYAKPLLGGAPGYPIEGLLPSLFYLQFTDLYVQHRPLESVLASYIPWWGQSWSLAVEEQYYMLWPLAVLAFRRHISGLIGICLLLMAIGLWCRLQGLAEYLLLTRIDGLALGSILGVLLHPTQGIDWSRVRRWAHLALLLSLPLVLEYLWRGYGHGIASPIGLSDDHALLVPAFALFYFGLIALIVIDHPRGLRWLTWRPLTHAGQLSYSIYIFHLPIAGVLGMGYKVLNLTPGLPVKLAAVLILSWLTAELLRIYVERPMAKLKRHFPMADGKVSVSASREKLGTPIGIGIARPLQQQ